jgi:hypothetical protein
MKLRKYYKMGKFIFEKIRDESTATHCKDCSFWRICYCEIYGGIIAHGKRKLECIKETG